MNKSSKTVREVDQPVRHSRSANSIDTSPGQQHGKRVKQMKTRSPRRICCSNRRRPSVTALSRLVRGACFGGGVAFMLQLWVRMKMSTRINPKATQIVTILA